MPRKAQTETSPETPPVVPGGSTKAAHRVWSGSLSFGLITAPVTLLTAATEERISFRQLCPTHRGPIKQQLMCEACGTPKAKAELLKGYETQTGYVVVSEAELEAAEPQSAKVLDLIAFVPATQVDPIFFESSYYLAPTEGGQKPFALVREAMVAKGVVGVARLVRSSKEHICIIRPYGDKGMMLQQLYWNDEVRLMAFPALPEVNSVEVGMAAQLIDFLAADWNPANYRDGYRESVMSLINAKLEGKEVSAAPVVEHKAQVINIADALAQSLAAMKAKKEAAA